MTLSGKLSDDAKRYSEIIMFRNFLFIFITLLLGSVPVFASDSKPEKVDTKTIKVDINQVLEDVYALVDSEKGRLFNSKNEELDGLIYGLFDDSILRSRLEQFYTMLFYISKYASIEKDEVVIDRDLTIRLLISSRVFSNPEFPKRITKVYLSRHNREKPFYKVLFDSDRVELDLNWGNDFEITREGMQQQAKALVFYGSFSFHLRKKEENVEAYDFEDVDLYGSFGSRGFINVDINYVAVKSVEFHKESEFALVRAKVSRKEFEINEHTWLLNLVTKFVTDKSLQSIDW